MADEIQKLFLLLGDGRIDSHQNWKGRFKDNSDRMRSGSIYDVVEVLKSLTWLSKSKNLSFREKRMLDRAKFLVVSEIAEVTHEATTAIEGKVEQALDQSLQAKNTKPLVKPVPKPVVVAVAVTVPPVLPAVAAKAVAAKNVVRRTAARA